MTYERTLVFIESSVPLFADVGARYVARLTASAENPAIPHTTFQPQEWLDYNYRNLPWTTTHSLMLDEFPGVIFGWTPYNVTAQENSNVKDLFGGWPVWNVFLADLNGDGFPEFCATISVGSGIVDTRVLVYDYANDTFYDLSDRAVFDYSLSLQNGRLIVTQTGYADNTVLSVGDIAIIDSQLIVFGIDRAVSDVDS